MNHTNRKIPYKHINTKNTLLMLMNRNKDNKTVTNLYLYNNGVLNLSLMCFS